jgi:aldose 1-epimerase
MPITTSDEQEDPNSMMTKPVSCTTAEPDDTPTFTLGNANGMKVEIGENATLRAWRAPDRYGRIANVLLPACESPAPAAGAWQGRPSASGVSLLHTAPGSATTLQVDFRLADDGSLVIDHKLKAEAATPLPPNAHPCFNLNPGSPDAGDHMLLIDADYFVEVDADGAPVGVAAVGGTPFDFREPAPIGPRLQWPDSQMRLIGGFDHCFFVRNHFAGGQGALREVARVFDPGSGRRLQMYTTEAALQLCAGKGRADTRTWGPAGRVRRQAGFCLGANARPSLRSAAWPQLILHPGQVYRQTTIYRLSLQELIGYN